MKKLLLLSIALVMTTALFAQTNKSTVGLNQQFHQKDTTITFSFVNADLDSCRTKLLKHWSNPTMNEAGTIIWNNIDLPNVGDDLSILVSDRICTMGKNDMTCMAFISDKDKAEKLKALKENQFRDMEVTVSDKAGNNIINNKSKTEIMVMLLERIIQN